MARGYQGLTHSVATFTATQHVPEEQWAGILAASVLRVAVFEAVPFEAVPFGAGSAARAQAMASAITPITRTMVRSRWVTLRTAAPRVITGSASVSPLRLSGPPVSIPGGQPLAAEDQMGRRSRAQEENPDRGQSGHGDHDHIPGDIGVPHR